MSCDSKKYIPLANGNISFTVQSSQKADINFAAAMFKVGSDDDDASDSDFFCSGGLEISADEEGEEGGGARGHQQHGGGAHPLRDGTLPGDGGETK